METISSAIPNGPRHMLGRSLDHLVLAAPPNSAEEEKVRHVLPRAFPPPCRDVIRVMDAIPRPPSNKLRTFVNEFSPSQ